MPHRLLLYVPSLPRRCKNHSHSIISVKTLYNLYVAHSLYIAEAEIAPSIELLLASMMKDPKPEMVSRVASKGCHKILDDLLKKWPEQVYTTSARK